MQAGGQQAPVSGSITTKWWSAIKMAIKEQAGQFAAGVEQPGHLLGVGLTQGGMDGAEKGLFQDQVVVAGMLKEVAMDDANGGMAEMLLQVLG